MMLIMPLLYLVCFDPLCYANVHAVKKNILTSILPSLMYILRE